MQNYFLKKPSRQVRHLSGSQNESAKKLIKQGAERHRWTDLGNANRNDYRIVLPIEASISIDQS